MFRIWSTQKQVVEFAVGPVGPVTPVGPVGPVAAIKQIRGLFNSSSSIFF